MTRQTVAAIATLAEFMPWDDLHAAGQSLRNLSFQQRGALLMQLHHHLHNDKGTLAAAIGAHGDAEHDVPRDLDWGLDVLWQVASTVAHEWPNAGHLNENPGLPLDKQGSNYLIPILLPRKGVFLAQTPDARWPCTDLLRDLALSCLSGQPCVWAVAATLVAQFEPLLNGIMTSGALQAGSLVLMNADDLSHVALPADAYAGDETDARLYQGIAQPGLGLAVLDVSVVPGTARFRCFVREVAWTWQRHGAGHDLTAPWICVPEGHRTQVIDALRQQLGSGHDAFPGCDPHRMVASHGGSDDVMAMARGQRRALALLACDADEARWAWVEALGRSHQHVRLVPGEFAAEPDAAVDAWMRAMTAIEAQALLKRLKQGLRAIDLSGSPTDVAHGIGEYLPGALLRDDTLHPFRRHFEGLRIGDSWLTHRRTVSEADIVAFGGVSGDYFYMHFDEVAAKSSLFGQRIAHGYFVLSATAGLFVWPGEGPVLANYGLDNLRFIKPVFIGDTIQARLTCKRKIDKPRRPGQRQLGVVHWDVLVLNQRQEPVARYDVLTLVAKQTAQQGSPT